MEKEQEQKRIENEKAFLKLLSEIEKHNKEREWYYLAFNERGEYRT